MSADGIVGALTMAFICLIAEILSVLRATDLANPPQKDEG